MSVTIGNIADGITEIGEHFLDGTKNLKSVDFSGLSSIKKLGYDFLDECGLESADMSLLVSVEEIADSFMTDPNNLKRINLSGFESVKTIGNRFLFHVYNENFTTVDLTPLRNVKKIGAGAFMRSYYLTSINTSSIKAEVFDVDGLDSAGKNIYSFASDNNTYPIYTTGVKITGDDASNIKARFPARDEEPYRK